MKYLLIGMLFFLIHIEAIGNTVGVMIGNVENVYYRGMAVGEDQYQNQAIAFLCNKYLKKYYPLVKERVFLELGYRSPELSYNKIQFDFKNKIEEFGIVIKVSQKAELTLKLLDYAIVNFQELKRSSANYFKMSEYNRPHKLTVDSVILSNVLKSPNSERIKNTLAIKVFRNLGRVNYNLYKEYYFQNDRWYFIDYMNKDSVYLELNQIFQILDEYYLGSLIFDTDSTGYFYNREIKKLSPKFMIENKKEAFYFNHTSSDNGKKRIYFEYDNWKEGKKKFIYLTDKLILIQKVEELEDKMINVEIGKRMTVPSN